MRGTAFLVAASFALGMAVGYFSCSLLHTRAALKAETGAKALSVVNLRERQSADVAQQQRISGYEKGVEQDESDTAMLLSLLSDVNRLHSEVADAQPETRVASDTCTDPRAEARRLSTSLQATLVKYGYEAQRADKHTRLLNLCVLQLAADRDLLLHYR